MDEIKDIYSREVYRPFVEYCAAHGYRTMRDLGCYDFRLLSRREDFTPTLITRIRAVYTAYQKSQVEKEDPALSRRRTPQPLSPVEETSLLLRLRAFLQDHQDRTVSLDEFYRELDGQLKRTRIVKLLSGAAWCRQVDRNTYYWAGSAPSAGSLYQTVSAQEDLG